MELLKSTLEKIEGLNEKAMAEAKERIDNLIKPQRSLGKLEDIAIQLSGITGDLHPALNNKAIIVMSADNGLCEEGVAAAPQAVTKMMTSYIAGGVSGVCALAMSAV